MTALTRQAPRPRASARIPSYPAVVVVTAAVLSGCAGSAPAPAAPASQAPEIAVVGGAVRAPQPALIAAPDNPPAPSPEAPWRLNPGTYPNDDAEVAIGCGGGCPPAWQLEADYRDRRQIVARVQHCYELVGGGKSGKVQVTLSIDGQGRVRTVQAKHTGEIPALVDECAAELLQAVQFQATNNYARSPSFDEQFPQTKKDGY